MKNTILLLIFSSLTFSIFGQNKLLDILPIQDGIVTYTGIVQVDSISKNTLYLRAKQWFVKTYKSAKDVIQLDDKENGEITGKGNFQISYYTRDSYINHTVSIYVKEGRYKYIITQFTYADNQGDKFAIENFPQSWAGKKKLYTKIDEEANNIIGSIGKAVKTNINTEW